MRRVLFLFGQLRDQDIDWFAEVGAVEFYDAGVTLIRQGMEIDRIYILLDGSLIVSTESAGRLAQLAPGEVVGEISFVNSLPPSADVIADAPSKLFSIPRELLSRRLDRDVEFASRFYKSIAMFLADRLRSTVQRLGYGSASQSQPADTGEELDDLVLDTVYMAGLRFERLVNMLSAVTGPVH
jgi:CRP/FNR family transcriptional regulator, cyclic AMP receptor protein